MRVKKTDWIAMKNRLEYLRDRTARQEEKIQSYKESLEELQKKHDEQIAELALKYGGQIEIPMHGVLEDYNVRVTMVKKEERA